MEPEGGINPKGEQKHLVKEPEGDNLEGERKHFVIEPGGGIFEREFGITWGDGHAKILNNGTLLNLTLGNSSGNPYTLHTNVYCQGKGNREQQFYLWFDPTLDSINWNPLNIIFAVDGTPIRAFKNLETNGIPFPINQPMSVYSSLWNADDWATQGGHVKTDWSKAPFSASYRNYTVEGLEACIWSEGRSSCDSSSSSSAYKFWMSEKINSTGLERVKWVQKNHMVYNYCVDNMRFHEGLPPECKMT